MRWRLIRRFLLQSLDREKPPGDHRFRTHKLASTVGLHACELLERNATPSVCCTSSSADRHDQSVCAWDAPTNMIRRELDWSLGHRRLGVGPRPVIVELCARSATASIRKGRPLLIRRQIGGRPPFRLAIEGREAQCCLHGATSNPEHCAGRATHSLPPLQGGAVFGRYRAGKAGPGCFHL